MALPLLGWQASRNWFPSSYDDQLLLFCISICGSLSGQWSEGHWTQNATNFPYKGRDDNDLIPGFFLRILLGLEDSRCVSGSAFSPCGPRSTWPPIRFNVKMESTAFPWAQQDGSVSPLDNEQFGTDTIAAQKRLV